jgi:hypothetical protein
MERIDQLEREVRNLSLAVRLGVSVVIAAFAIQSCVILARAPHFRTIFAELLEGTALPVMTTFFLTFATPIVAGSVVLALLAITAQFVFARQVWCIPFGVFVAITTVAVAQLANFAFQMPFFQIISSLAK